MAELSNQRVERIAKAAEKKTGDLSLSALVGEDASKNLQKSLSPEVLNRLHLVLAAERLVVEGRGKLDGNIVSGKLSRLPLIPERLINLIAGDREVFLATDRDQLSAYDKLVFGPKSELTWEVNNRHDSAARFAASSPEERINAAYRKFYSNEKLRPFLDQAHGKISAK